jgi:hypothetical protein
MTFRPRAGRVVYPSIHLRIVKDQETQSVPERQSVSDT